MKILAAGPTFALFFISMRKAPASSCRSRLRGHSSEEPIDVHFTSSSLLATFGAVVRQSCSHIALTGVALTRTESGPGGQAWDQARCRMHRTTP